MKVKTAIKKINEMIEGCNNVYDDRELGKNARDLAKLVKEDCYELLNMIERKSNDKGLSQKIFNNRTSHSNQEGIEDYANSKSS
jgi:hypothetical protein